MEGLLREISLGRMLELRLNLGKLITITFPLMLVRSGISLDLRTTAVDAKN